MSSKQWMDGLAGKSGFTTVWKRFDFRETIVGHWVWG